MPWRHIESLFRHLGEVEEGEGSRIRVTINGIRGNFHRPHPEKVAGVKLIRDVRKLLETAGVQP